MTVTDSSAMSAPAEYAWLHALARCAVEQPAALAVHASDATLTYEELDARAARLAAQINAATPSGGLIAVCVERSAALIVAVLAVLKSGRPYLALDPAE